MSRLADLLASPEQLDKIDTLIERTEKKLDLLQNQLSSEIQIQLQRASVGLSSLDSCSDPVQTLRTNFKHIDRRYLDASNLVPEYALVKRLMVAFQTVTTVVEETQKLQKIPEKISQLNQLLKDDRNMLLSYTELCDLQRLRNEALSQMEDSPSERRKLEMQFGTLDSLFDQLENQLWQTMENAFVMCQKRPATLVMAVRIIEREEKADRLRSNSFRASRSLRSEPLQRNFRTKAFSKMRNWILNHFDLVFHDLEDDIFASKQYKEHLASTGQQPPANDEMEDMTIRYLCEADAMFADLAIVQGQLSPCFPSHYNIFEFFVREYHKHFYGVISRFGNECKNLTAKDTLLLVKWVKNTYQRFLDQLGFKDLEPPLIEPLSELIKTYRIHIHKQMREMVVRAIETDKKDIPEMVDDVYMTFSYVTLFKVVKQQILMASATNYPEFVFESARECVDCIGYYQKNVLHMLTETWKDLDFEYIIALINNNRKSLEPLVAFQDLLSRALEEHLFVQIDLVSIAEGFTELSERAVRVLAMAIYRDVESAMIKIGTKEWKTNEVHLVSAIIDTFDDYFENEVSDFVPESTMRQLAEQSLELVVDGFSQEILKKKKSKLAPIDEFFLQRVKEDINTVHTYFSSKLLDRIVKEKCAVFLHLICLLSSDDLEDIRTSAVWLLHNRRECLGKKPQQRLSLILSNRTGTLASPDAKWAAEEVKRIVV